MIIFENVHTTPRRRLFKLLGVEWTATPYAWLSVPLYFVVGVVLACIIDSHQSIEARLLIGLAYSLMLHLSNALHSIGHTLSGRWVGAPMDENLITATFHVTLYRDDPARYSRWVHIGRSLGGPVANLLVGAAALGVWQLADVGGLAFFAVMNLATGVYTLLPIPSIDGGVIWSELLGRRSRLS
ncbi:MAG TPA: hypothetical protein VJG32_05015 [Anaerolineae bacterium]|nr:hypothetical protein [Anaerolineae bacterium]